MPSIGRYHHTDSSDHRILRELFELVELLLDINGRATANLEARFRNVLARRAGPDGQRYKLCILRWLHKLCILRKLCILCSFRGIHDCLVPVTPYLSGLFRHLKCNSKPPTRVRAMDMRHVLLLMPFLLDGLLTDEVEEYNSANPLGRISDPSPMMVDITVQLLSWYHLYRRRFPAKDLKDLDALGKQ